ncbi:WD40/YVTN/BNR-like repeat-containing protein [Janthinobacterium lividum]|uniref:WD40/YVTN/BNR-like repeat-containing protein n=1 Tax=Janthinobacterium lividum TaxID=29581 RepID=UPI00140B8468|nr:YCF48-related protein [Janthinobacterium lividum]NHQ91928.1 glycosyl hydrolase [Janthinobacterium lividum]
MYFFRHFILILIVLRVACEATAAEPQRWPSLLPAQRVPNATGAPLLAAALAGQRVVAVGDHGVVLLSDDGVRFRQAKAVPVRSMLTSVQFLDARRGYAAGHDGVVLGTQDGGDNWTLLRATPGLEQPVLSLHFDSVEHGFAVGLYGWAIETHDGGRSWTERHLGSGDNADRHLYHVFVSQRGTLLVAGEAGAVYRSTDGGATWNMAAAGGKGSLWYGTALADGTLLVCGMRGHLYRSRDDGRTWQALHSNTTLSLTGIAQQADGSVLVAGMSGTVLRSTDGGATFTLAQRAEREPLTAVLAAGATPPVLLSLAGLVAR